MMKKKEEKHTYIGFLYVGSQSNCVGGITCAEYLIHVPLKAKLALKLSPASKLD